MWDTVPFTEGFYSSTVLGPETEVKTEESLRSLLQVDPQITDAGCEQRIINM